VERTAIFSTIFHSNSGIFAPVFIIILFL